MRNNPARLAELQRLAILDTAPERAFDDITRLVASTLGVPITMVNLLDAGRDWFKSKVGMQAAGSSIADSFCEAFFSTDSDLIVIEDTLLDARTVAHPLVLGPPHIRFYVAARLLVGGQTVGTLCAYDVHTRRVSPDQIEHLRSMATAVIELLNQRFATSKAG